MVLFTDPIAHTLWIGRATPRVWLQSGRNVTIEHAPTRYGRLSFSILAASGTTINANITFSSTLVSKRAAFASPQQGFEWPEGGLALRLRHPGFPATRLKSVMVGKEAWTHFNASSETIVFAQMPSDPAVLQNIVATFG